MYVCLCNGITDKTIDEKLSAKSELIDIKKIKELYAECSDGKDKQCGKCLTQFRDAAKNRNEDIIASTMNLEPSMIRVVNL